MKYFAIVLFCTTSIYAQELKAPTECVIGELVILDASEMSSEEVIWKVLKVDNTLMECVDFKAFGKVACFSARESGMWLVIVSGVFENKPCMLTHSITVGTVSPPIVNNLETKMKEWTSLVKSKNVQVEALKLAQSFKIIALTNLPVEKMLMATASANKQALGKSLEAWIPFLDKLGTYLDELAEANKLQTQKDYEIIWLQISDAIERSFK